ncbi:hypothetical protein [Blastococcus sp. TF02A-26]|uniref:hypothetical protein n=1 Tax=Blastococcus sp. TF02A-26 TaxID=2250577 RepID=UPI000DE99C27|nr:hypothetical protein [Blastococcus sp. TF02A-26]RBY82674.1 hypothetical protein DQ240_18445 [Blastococcus sp. TF02A-26]
MARACDQPRCPARADVDDWTTTEYRKGCRLTACTAANRLATQRRRDKKRNEGVDPEATAVVRDVDEPAASSGGEAWAFDVVGAVRAELAEADLTHPFRRSLTSIALALANQLQLSLGQVTPSATGAARQLAVTLQQLLPQKADKSELDELLADLASDDDDDDGAA